MTSVLSLAAGYSVPKASLPLAIHVGGWNRAKDIGGTIKRHFFFQYPRGQNKGLFLKTSLCPTITINAWQENVFLVESFD